MTAEQKLKNQYPRIFRLSVLAAIVLHAIMFLILPEWEPQPYQLREKRSFEAIEIPDQFKIPPPPKEEVKEQIPTEIEPSEDASEEETIASTELDVEAPPELPPAPQRPGYFVAFDEPPQVIHQVQPEYTELGRMSELEGLVMLQVGIDEFGNVIEATVVQSLGAGLDEAAVKAVKQWKFRPAKQRDMPVPVQIYVPIRFTLRG
jgi:protein TonB